MRCSIVNNVKLTGQIISQVLYLPVGSGYKVYRPLRYGRLNCSNNESPSPQSTSLSRTNLLSMLEDLWTKAFEEYLQIDKREFKVCV